MTDARFRCWGQMKSDALRCGQMPSLVKTGLKFVVIQMLTRNGVNNARFKSDANQIHSQISFKDPDVNQMLSD
jgi:hypothetical protein